MAIKSYQEWSANKGQPSNITPSSSVIPYDQWKSSRPQPKDPQEKKTPWYQKSPGRLLTGKSFGDALNVGIKNTSSFTNQVVTTGTDIFRFLKATANAMTDYQKGGISQPEINKKFKATLSRDIYDNPKSAEQILKTGSAGGMTVMPQYGTRADLEERRRTESVLSAKRELPSNYVEPSYLKGGGQESFNLGSSQAAIGFGRGLEGLFKKLGFRNAYENIASKTDEARKLIEKNPEWQMSPEQEKITGLQLFKNPDVLARQVTQSLPNMVGAVAITTAGTLLGGPAAGAVAGFSTTASLEGGLAYNDAIDSGLSVKDAEYIATNVGVINGLLEMLPIFRIVNKTIAGKKLFNTFTKNVGSEMIKQFAAEGVTESMQEITQIAMNEVVKENPDIWKAIVDEKDRILTSGVVGGVSGALMGGLGGTIQATSSKQTDTTTKAEEITPADFNELPTGGEKQPEETPTQTNVAKPGVATKIAGLQSQINDLKAEGQNYDINDPEAQVLLESVIELENQIDTLKGVPKTTQPVVETTKTEPVAKPEVKPKEEPIKPPVSKPTETPGGIPITYTDTGKEVMDVPIEQNEIVQEPGPAADKFKIGQKIDYEDEISTVIGTDENGIWIEDEYGGTGYRENDELDKMIPVEEELVTEPSGTTPSAIRDRVDYLAEEMDKFDGKKRANIIEEYNKLRDQDNKYVDKNKEVAFVVPSKNVMPYAEINVVKYDDDKYAYQYNVNTDSSGAGGPFSGKYNTKEEAISSGVSDIQEFIDNSKGRSDTSTASKAILLKIEKELKKITSDQGKMFSVGVFDEEATRRKQAENRRLEQKREELRKKGKVEGRQTTLTEAIVEKPKPKVAPKVKPGIYTGEQGKLLNVKEGTGSIAKQITKTIKEKKPWDNPDEARTELTAQLEIGGKKRNVNAKAISDTVNQINKLNDKAVIQIKNIVFVNGELIGDKLRAEGYWDQISRTIGVINDGKTLAQLITHETIHASWNQLTTDDQNTVIKEYKLLSEEQLAEAFGGKKMFEFYAEESKSKSNPTNFMANEYFAREAQRIFESQKPVTTSQKIINIIMKALKWLSGRINTLKAPTAELKAIYKKIYTRTAELSQQEAIPEPSKMLSVGEQSFGDKFGFTFLKEKVEVDKLISDPKFQPRVSDSARATEDSVYRNGYDEGLVTQPLVVNKVGDQYIVLGGHSRTRGLQHREAEGLANPKEVEAYVYNNLSEADAKKVSRAANQQTSEEALLDKAKSINESIKDKQEPQVPKQNMKKGFTYDDYAKLWDIVQSDPTGNLRVFIQNGVIDEGNALNMAQNANTRELSTEDVLGIYNVVVKQGKGLSYERFNQAAKLIDMARAKSIGKEKQTSLFGDAKTSERLADNLNKIEAEKNRLKGVVGAIKKLEKFSKEDGIALGQEWEFKKVEIQNEINKIEKNEIDDLIASWGGTKQTDTEHLNNVVANEEAVAVKLEESNTTSDPAVNAKADETRKESEKSQVSFGRQELQVDLTEFHNMMKAIPMDAEQSRKTELVLEAMAKKKELMEKAGFVKINHIWKKVEGKIDNQQDIPISLPGDHTDVYEDPALTDANWSEGNLEMFKEITVQENKVAEKVREMEDKDPKKWEAFRNMYQNFLKTLGSPGERLTQVWREVLVPMEGFSSFTSTEVNALASIYKKNKIKVGSESDQRATRIADNTATIEDKENATARELSLASDFREFTNSLLDKQKEKYPRILVKMRELLTGVVDEYREISGGNLMDMLPSTEILTFEERQEDNERVMREREAVRDYDIQNGTNLSTLLTQGIEIVRNIAKVERALNNLTNRAEEYYMPRVRLKNRDDIQFSSKQSVRRRANLNKQLTGSLEKRTDDRNEVETGASGFELLEHYVRGVGHEMYLRLMYLDATREAEKYTGNKLIEARDYIAYLQKPQNIAAWSIFITRGFASAQLGVRTQLKNLAHGQGMIVAETKWSNYLGALKLLFTNRKKFNSLLIDEEGQTVHFIQSVQNEILGMVGATGVEKSSKIFKKIQSYFPSSILMRIVENFNRPIAYVAGMLQGQSQGLSGEALTYHAWNVVTKTQFNYGIHAMPGFLRGIEGKDSGVKIKRIASQYILTKIRDQEQILTHAAKKDWGYVARYMMGKMFFFYLISLLWPEKKRITAEGKEYTSGDISIFEGIDIFDFRRMKLVWDIEDQTSLEMMWNLAVASAEGFMAPALQFGGRLVGWQPVTDKVYNKNKDNYQILKDSIVDMIPESNLLKDMGQIMSEVGLMNKPGDYSMLTTITAVNDLIKEAQKAGDQTEVDRLKKEYPVYQFKSLAREYEKKINALDSEYTKKKKKETKDVENENEKTKIERRLKAEKQKEVDALYEEFETELNAKMEETGVKFTLREAIGIPTANAMTVYSDYITNVVGAERNTDVIMNMYVKQMKLEDIPMAEEEDVFGPRVRNRITGKVKPEPLNGPRLPFSTETVSQEQKSSPQAKIMPEERTLGTVEAVAPESILSSEPIPSTPDKYKDVIKRNANVFGTPVNILSALAEQETGWQEKWINKVGEAGTGITQWTGIGIAELARLGYTNPDGSTFTRKDALNPAKAIRATAYMLTVLKDRHGSWYEAVRNYNGNNALNKNGERVKDAYVRSIWGKL